MARKEEKKEKKGAYAPPRSVPAPQGDGQEWKKGHEERKEKKEPTHLHGLLLLHRVIERNGRKNVKKERRRKGDYAPPPSSSAPPGDG